MDRTTRWRWLCAALVALVALFLCPAALVAAEPKPSEPQTGQQLNALVIAGDPLSIHVGSNASIQVYYSGYPLGQVFGDADSGIFFWVGNDVYGSNLNGTHGFSVANDTLDLTMLGHSGPSGNGSAGDPWVVTTVADVGTTGLRVTQEVAYVQGSTFFRTVWRVENRGTSPVEYDLFHAADLFLGGSDEGYGYYDPASGAIGGHNQRRDWFLSFSPQVPATHYQESYYDLVWQAIGNCDAAGCVKGPGLNDTISGDWLDNGIGLQWHGSLAPGQGSVVSDVWSFGPLPTPTPPPSPTATATPEPTPTRLPSATPPPVVTPSPFPMPTATAVVPTPPPTPPAEIPEAGSLVLLGSGLASLVGYLGLSRAGRKKRSRT